MRGTSSNIIVEALKKAGAKKVKMVVTFPPISYPCYMGVDFPSREELIAHQVANGDNDIETIGRKVAKAIGVERVPIQRYRRAQPGHRPPEGQHVLRLHQRRLLQAGHHTAFQDQEGDEGLNVRIGILVSGRGSNLEAILLAVRRKYIRGASVAVVVSNKPGRASSRGR